MPRTSTVRSGRTATKSTGRTATVNASSDNAPFTFAWFTDIHIGRGGTFDPGQPEDAFDYVGTNFPDISFVMASGDITDNSTTAEFNSFLSKKSGSTLASKTWYFLPGNHDEGAGLEASGGTADGPATYAEYDAAGFPRRWSFSQGGYKFIGFTSYIRRNPDPLEGFGNVSSTDLTYLENELISAGSDKPFVFSHFGLSNAIGNNIKGTPQTNIFSLMNTYNARVYFHGHRHADLREDDDTSVYHVNGECVAYSVPNSTGSFEIVTVDGNTITVRAYLRISPWTLQDTVIINL